MVCSSRKTKIRVRCCVIFARGTYGRFKEQLSSRLRDVENQLSRVREEKQGLKDQVAALNTDIHTLRTSKVDAEAERDEVKSQMRAMRQQEEETFRLDQERVDLRTAKMKLDGEIRRLKEENKSAVAAQQTLEKELQQEIDRASAEETRLTSEVQDLQRILRGSSEKKELAAARKTIHHLESRVRELESQIASDDNHTDVTNELSMVRRDLSIARGKETEYLQREASQKDVIRGLKRQISDLERNAHDAEISRLAVVSPHSSFNGSARKTELAEARHQLSAAHETLKDLRTQLKNAQKDGSRRLNAVNIDLQAKSEAWELEKDKLERDLDEALLKRDQLAAQNNTSEATISRLRSKIERLEQALQTERLSFGEDRTIAFERHDLHEMLRESQVQVEALELVVKERESMITNINRATEKLNKNINRIREDRDSQKAKADSAQVQLKELELQFKEATATWEADKHNQTDKNVGRLREDRDMHRAKAEAAGKRLAELDLKLKEFSNINATADRMNSNMERIRAERDELRAHVERSHIRIAVLEAEITKAVAGWEAEKRLSKDVDRLRKERNELLAAHKSHEEQLTQLELNFNAQGVTTTATEKHDSEIRHIREERDRLRAKAETASKQLETLELKFQEANEAWDFEKLTLTRGVRFPHMSISINEDEIQLLNQIERLKSEWTEKESVHLKTIRTLESKIEVLKRECSEKDSYHSKDIRSIESRIESLRGKYSEKETYHSKNVRSLQMQVDWWRAKCDREAMFRDMGTYVKKYMRLQIEMYEAW